jgi:hypothetical protein
VVKSNAWEYRFKTKIEELRDTERGLARKLGMVMGIVNVVGNNSIDFISWAVVFVYTILMVRARIATIGPG